MLLKKLDQKSMSVVHVMLERSEASFYLNCRV